MQIKKIKGNFNIHNYSDSTVGISIEDETSGCHLMEISMDRKTFADALFGHYNNPVEFYLTNTDLIGKTREHKTVIVKRIVLKGEKTHVYDDQKKIAERSFKEHEVDGWKGYTEDLFNHHRAIRGSENEFSVNFVRYV